MAPFYAASRITAPRRENAIAPTRQVSNSVVPWPSMTQTEHVSAALDMSCLAAALAHVASDPGTARGSFLRTSDVPIADVPRSPWLIGSIATTTEAQRLLSRSLRAAA